MPAHRITRLTLETVAADAAAAAALADRAAAAVPRLADIVARRLDVVDDGRRFRLDRVELTLAGCDPAAFEADLADRLDAALARALPIELARADPVDEAADALDLLATFADAGVLPWWAAGDALALDRAARQAAAGDDPRIERGLRALLGRPSARIRLARSLTGEAAAALAARLAGLPVDAVAGLAAALTRRSSARGARAGEEAVRAALLQACAAASPPVAVADVVRAVDALVRASAQAEPTSRPAPRTSPPASEQAERVAGPSSMPSPTIPHDSRRDGAGEAVPTAEAALPAAAPLRPDDGATGAGRASDAVRERQPSASLPTAMPTTAADRPPHAQRASSGHPVIDAPPPTDPPRRNTAEGPDRGDGSIGHGPMSTTADMAVPPGDGAGAAVVISDAVASAAQSSGPPRSLDRDLPGPAASPPIPASTIPAPARPPARAGLAALAHDTIAVEAAGVLLLWPLIPDCLAAAGLVDADRRFRSPTAQGRAATLIDHLATGAPASPEWRLPLAKLLAGLPLDALVENGLPPDEAEAAAVAATLVSALDRLPMLGRLSLAGLREAWLRRPGVIAVEPDRHVVHVERREWDVLLARVPWQLGWVRLPWMADAVRVQW